MRNTSLTNLSTANFKSFSFSYQGYLYFSAGYFALEKLKRENQGGTDWIEES